MTENESSEEVLIKMCNGLGNKKGLDYDQENKKIKIILLYIYYVKPLISKNKYGRY